MKKATKASPLVPDRLSVDEQSILHFAMRYALGRATAAPTIVISRITLEWNRISTATRRQMQEEISEAINDGLAGHHCDVVRWQEILKLKIE